MKKIKFMWALTLSVMFFFSYASIIMAWQTPPLIRLHILANSNEKEDQMNKLIVRDKIISQMSAWFEDSRSLEESRHLLLDNLSQLEKEAQKTLQKAGSSYRVKAYYGTFEFPTKYYGTFSLPAGRYEAVRLVIGEGKGANWWCVLFPPLCLVDGKNIKETPVKNGNTDGNTTKNNTGMERTVQLKPALAVVEAWNKVYASIAAKI